MPADPGHDQRWSGVIYTTSDDLRFQGCLWTDWFFNKSKKVWFRIPPSGMKPEAPRIYFYRGRPILRRRTWEALPASERARLTPAVLWGDEVASGWGRGPKGTNHFLYIWTRWSLLQPGACGHPERFAVELGSPLATTTQGAHRSDSPGGES